MKRVLLKISGEALSQDSLAIHPQKAEALTQLISSVAESGVEIVIVFGGGNIYRGSKLIESGVDAADSHNMSMLSTVFNALTMKNFLEKIGKPAIVLDALGVEFLERYTSLIAKRYIESGNIVICSSGSGSPFFTTDTGGVLRALELHCEAVVKLTKVDGVYDSDPIKNLDAKKYDTLSYNECIEKNLKILDTTAVVMARDHNLPIYVSHLEDTHALLSLLAGKSGGTKIS